MQSQLVCAVLAGVYSPGLCIQSRLLCAVPAGACSSGCCVEAQLLCAVPAGGCPRMLCAVPGLSGQGLSWGPCVHAHDWDGLVLSGVCRVVSARPSSYQWGKGGSLSVSGGLWCHTSPWLPPAQASIPTLEPVPSGLWLQALAGKLIPEPLAGIGLPRGSAWWGGHRQQVGSHLGAGLWLGFWVQFGRHRIVWWRHLGKCQNPGCFCGSLAPL